MKNISELPINGIKREGINLLALVSRWLKAAPWVLTFAHPRLDNCDFWAGSHTLVSEKPKGKKQEVTIGRGQRLSNYSSVKLAKECLEFVATAKDG